MSHSYYKMWLHVVFSTKHRLPLIKLNVEAKIYSHIKQQLEQISCPVRIINGMPDHIHLLILQNPKMAVADIVKQIKGSSSHWINAENIVSEKFAWQTGYAAFSVSESQIEKVFRYIQNQKEHHKRKTFTAEYEEFISIHDLEKIND